MRGVVVSLVALVTVSAAIVQTENSGATLVPSSDKPQLSSILNQDEDFDENGDNVLFRFYTRDRLEGPLVLGLDAIPLKNIDLRSRPIKVVVHGWRGHEHCAFTKAIKQGFFPEFDFIMLSVDWSRKGSLSPFYPVARRMVAQVGRELAAFLDKLPTYHGVSLGSIHIIGHSLGAHVAGIAGRLVTKGTIGRITGVDPAGPYFKMEDKEGRLSRDSAEFVDVIHTSSDFLGFGYPLGQIDFYPNGGHVSQPGCGPDLTGRCSHNRSFHFYIESLINPFAFPAVACKDWEHFRKKECNENDTVLMGELAPPMARGVYYLATNKKSPFGLGSIWSRNE